MDKAHVLRDDLTEYIVDEIICPPPLIHVEKLAVTCGEQVSTGTESRLTARRYITKILLQNGVKSKTKQRLP